MTPDYFKEKAFLRKIKKEIKAKNHTYILKVPPFFASQAAAELKKYGFAVDEEPQITPAGVEISGNTDLLYNMHAKLQIPSRIMMETGSFRTGAVEELFKRAKAIPWELYINPRIPLRIQPRVRRSRIEHEGAAEDTLYMAIRARFIDSPWKQYVFRASDTNSSQNNQQIQRIDLNIEENHCRLAVDTSGEHLHKRGYRALTSEAPIRETLAAGFLFWVLERIEYPDCVLDPMCGSGTFPIEFRKYSSASSLLSEAQKRDFLFEKLPWHRTQAWKYSKNQEFTALFPQIPVFASDIDAKTIDIARKNIDASGENKGISLDCSNFFHLDFTRYTSKNSGLIITNLPYGVRKSEGTSDFIMKFIAHAKKQFPGWAVACISPENVIQQGIKDSISFFNGGIRVNGVILDI